MYIKAKNKLVKIYLILVGSEDYFRHTSKKSLNFSLANLLVIKCPEWPKTFLSHTEFLQSLKQVFFNFSKLTKPSSSKKITLKEQNIEVESTKYHRT